MIYPWSLGDLVNMLAICSFVLTNVVVMSLDFNLFLMKGQTTSMLFGPLIKEIIRGDVSLFLLLILPQHFFFFFFFSTILNYLQPEHNVLKWSICRVVALPS